MRTTIRKLELSRVLPIWLIGVSVSGLKFLPCRSSNFSGIESVRSSCYSDVPVFLDGKKLVEYNWDFNSPVGIEYPVLIVLILWISTSVMLLFGQNSALAFFDIHLILMSILYLLVILLVKSKSKYWRLTVFIPLIPFSMLINWDLWTIPPLLSAIYFFDRGKFFRSSTMLAVATSIKFFPLFILFPASLIFLMKSDYRSFLKFQMAFWSVWTAINLPFAFWNWYNFQYFYALSRSRQVGYGSIWEAIQLLGFEQLAPLNPLSGGLTVMLVALIGFRLSQKKHDIKLVQIAFLFLASSIFFNKVYSPQYIIWLLPLALISFQSNRRLTPAFKTWVAIELVFHFATWQYLYWQGWGQQELGLSEDLFAFVSIIRYLIVGWFILDETQRLSRNEGAPHQRKGALRKR